MYGDASIGQNSYGEATVTTTGVPIISEVTLEGKTLVFVVEITAVAQNPES